MSSKIALRLAFFILFIVSCKKNNPAPKAAPEISGFSIATKYVGDATFLIPQVTSNSTGAFTYSSSDAAVASIKGDSIQINSAGTVTITATQAGVASFTAGSVTTSFKVLPSVYITGWSYGSSGDQPIYWRNGIATNLSGLGTTNGILIHNNDVYITGGIQINGDGFGGYWKNGVPHPIQKNSVVNSIAVLGNDVYAVGYILTYDQSDNITATLWKNDVAIPLTNPLSCCGLVSSSIASAISINNNVIYITGTSYDIGNNGAATIWKADGTAVTLTTPNGTNAATSTAYGMTFQGNDMYISGLVSGADGSAYLGYWKNGIFFPGKSPAHLYSSNTSIGINGSDVYITAIVAGNGGPSAAYWKNGVETILASAGTANGIAFSGSDMYVVGTTITVRDFTAYPSPVYWLNGTLNNLPSTMPNNTTASSVFIRTQ